MPPSDDLRDLPALRPEGPQQDNSFLESEEFEALMYAYRVAPTTDQAAVIRRFEAVKAALSASRTAQAPQQEGVDLVTRLIDYRGQVLMGFRHISRLDEAELIMEAIDGLRQPSETGWQPLKTAPRHARCFFWVVPKTADECNTDTSGKPITLEGRAAPHRIDGEWGWWGSLWKPLYWMPLPSPPAPPVAPAEGEP